MAKKMKGEMAPNTVFAGGVKAVAENHGVGMGLGIGKKASTAHIQEWGDMSYAGEQHGNGSMDYNSKKMKMSASDASRLKKHAKRDTDY